MVEKTTNMPAPSPCAVLPVCMPPVAQAGQGGGAAPADVTLVPTRCHRPAGEGVNGHRGDSWPLLTGLPYAMATSGHDDETAVADVRAGSGANGGRRVFFLPSRVPRWSPASPARGDRGIGF
ncbi:hypothetical protein SEVIR_5G456250v4 [Setaria viridis]